MTTGEDDSGASRSDEEDIEKLLVFMKEQIRETKLPWVSWKTILDNAGKIVSTKRKERVTAALWNIVSEYGKTLAKSEKEPNAKRPRIYEYKMGNTWVYSPAKMIEKYVDSEEL